MQNTNTNTYNMKLTSFVTKSSSASFVAAHFDADMVAILIVVATVLDVNDDVDEADVDFRAAASVDSDPSSESKI
mgnify:CR=1 FL=1